MSVVTMLLGESGTGKTASLRHFEPQDTLLIQPVSKPLPFKSKGWRLFNKADCPQGNIIRTDNPQTIISALQKTQRRIIVIDDFQYIMANEFMRRTLDAKTKNSEFEKFNEIAKNTWDILRTATALPASKRVYLLSHTEKADDGSIKAKTIGKLLDNKIGMEGMVTIVLRTLVRDGAYLFATRNNGSDTTKTPMGLFDSDTVENDLAQVDAAIVDYYADDELMADSAPPKANSLPDYTPEQLETHLDEWRGLIESGKRTAAQIIAMVSSKYRLSEEQKAQILALEQSSERDNGNEQ